MKITLAADRGKLEASIGGLHALACDPQGPISERLWRATGPPFARRRVP